MGSTTHDSRTRGQIATDSEKPWPDRAPNRGCLLILAIPVAVAVAMMAWTAAAAIGGAQ